MKCTCAVELVKGGEVRGQGWSADGGLLCWNMRMVRCSVRVSELYVWREEKQKKWATAKPEAQQKKKVQPQRTEDRLKGTREGFNESCTNTRGGQMSDEERGGELWAVPTFSETWTTDFYKNRGIKRERRCINEVTSQTGGTLIGSHIAEVLSMIQLCSHAALFGHDISTSQPANSRGPPLHPGHLSFCAGLIFILQV